MTLERATIVQTALALINETGIDGLTVRRIAARLGVRNPTLYWHFKNKQELLNSMAKHMLAEAFQGLTPPADADAWEEWLADVAGRLHGAFLSYRDGARVVASADLAGGQISQLHETVLGVLAEAGFDLRTAFWGIVTILDYTLGSAFEEQTDPVDTSVESDEDAQNLALSPDRDRTPTLLSALGAIGDAGIGDRQEGFHAGIGLILAGMRATMQAAQLRAHGADRQS